MRSLMKHLRNPEKLISYVKNGFDVYTELELRRWYKGTFFEAAIRWGTPELVKACIEAGANPNFIWLKREVLPLAVSSILTAIRMFRLDNLKVLLENGANVNYLRVHELNYIKWHMRRNLLPEFEHLQDFSKSEQFKITELKKELDTGAEIVRTLKEAGFHIPGISPDDTYSSFYALKHLVTFSALVDDDDEWYKKTPEEMLKRICSDGFPEDDEYFSEEYVPDGWPCLLPNHGSRSNALWHAVSPEALEQMLNDGADVNMRDDLGYTTLHHVAYYGTGNYYFKPEVMLQNLIDAGADVNDTDEYGVTALLLAAEKIRPNGKALELVKVLLRNGADYGAETADGRDIYYWSSEYWYTTGRYENRMLHEITSELIRNVKGESPLSDDDIDLMTAAFWAKPEDLKPILERGANINARTEHGYTPLMFASVYNYAPAVKFLIEHGAEINCENASGESALYLANLTEDEPMISTLIEKGADKECLSRPHPPRECTTHIEFFVPD